MRTAESDAAFLLPHIKKTDRILDVGGGLGLITTGLAKYASEGSIVGVDISVDDLQKAKLLFQRPHPGTGLEEGNVLEGLAYPNDTFDIVFAYQVCPCSACGLQYVVGYWAVQECSWPACNLLR